MWIVHWNKRKLIAVMVGCVVLLAYRQDVRAQTQSQQQSQMPQAMPASAPVGYQPSTELSAATTPGAVAPAGQPAPSTAMVLTAPSPVLTLPNSASPQYVPGQGLFIHSQDERFTFRTFMRGQMRYSFTHDNAADDKNSQVFELKRISLFFAGHVFGKHNNYFAQFVFAPRDLGLDKGSITQSPIFDFFMIFDHLRDFSLRVGQYKPFFSRQFIGSWGELTLIDRGRVQNEFHMERDLGFDLFSSDVGGLGHFRYYAGIYSGQGRQLYGPRAFHMTYLARVEALPFGLFDDYRESDLGRNSKPKLALGAAYSFQDNATNDLGVYGNAFKDKGTVDYHEAVADFMFKQHGLAVNGEVYWRQGTRNSGGAKDAAGVLIPTVAARNGTGYFLQAGYLLPKLPIELAVRGGQMFGLGNTSLRDGGELGGGINYYFADHPFKVQIDYFRTWTGTNIANGFDQMRMQLQVLM